MYQLQRATILLLTFATTAFSQQVFAHKDGGIVVKNAWVREAPPVSPVLAGYMIIENHTGKTKNLISVKSSAFQKIEIHRTVHKDGVASMEGQDKLPIAAEGKVELKPGGTHLMLINPTNRLKAGDTVSFTLIFANGSKSIISAKVKKASSMSSGHHKHEHNGDHGDHHKDNLHNENNHGKDHHDKEHGKDNGHHHKH